MAGRIDDIRPVRPAKPLAHLAPYVPPAPVRKPPLTTITPSAWGPRSPAMVDPMVHPARARPPAPATHKPEPSPAPSQPRLVARPQPERAKPSSVSRRPTTKKAGRWHRLADLAQYPLIAALALIAANNTTLGQWFVLAYAVYALIRRIRSQVSFGTALFLLVTIPMFQLLHQAGIAQNVAVYVYELLVVGTLQAVVELYKSRH